MIIGCDFHPSWQQIAWVDSETGETGEQKLVHASGEARKFYAQLRAPALIGIEATGNSQWFVEMVEDVGHAIWIGDAAAISSQLWPAAEDGQAGCGAHPAAAFNDLCQQPVRFPYNRSPRDHDMPALQ